MDLEEFPGHYAGRHVFKSVNELKIFEEEIAITTATNLVVSKADKHFFSTELAHLPKLSPQVLKFSFVKEEDGPFPEADGVPFTQLGHRLLLCHHGPDLSKRKKEKYAATKVMKQGDRTPKPLTKLTHPTKKFDCPVRVFMRKLWAFPEYKVCTMTAALKKEAKRSVCAAQDTRPGEIVFVVDVADISHSNHVQGEAAVRTERLDKRVVERVRHLGQIGVTKASAIKHCIEDLNKIELEVTACPHSATRRRYHPSEKDIRNILQTSSKLKKPYAGELPCLQSHIKQCRVVSSDEESIDGANIAISPHEESLQTVCEDHVAQQSQYSIDSADTSVFISVEASCCDTVVGHEEEVETSVEDYLDTTISIHNPSTLQTSCCTLRDRDLHSVEKDSANHTTATVISHCVDRQVTRGGVSILRMHRREKSEHPYSKPT